MNLLNTLKLAIFASFLAVAVFAIGANQPASAQENNSSEGSSHNDEESSNSSVYSYAAQPGDSYSLIARKAVQTYGAINKVNLSQAQIIYTETKLTLDAKSPNLVVGQKVEIKESDIEHEVEHARELTKAQEAAWNEYAQYADFNTDNVGQP